ncbi:uncharacterized protein LOC115760749 [Drosophila novamexicana]|uniref:uncharacterized protein LOC115760749 n=1 Tax=Drosophila novamexicana TaxID=47314 RepID=UPI0011E5B8D6|nr:uncharacterized protein LOC115760749 [Drosophila novamexicana]XP_030558087.1 uncharacterized protein LOC115760749 [Drosophila novamexicana]
MGSRYMVYWRVYVYSNNLYSLPERESRSFRDCTPLMYRRNSDEVHRLLSFANRELSVLLCNTQTELLTVFDVLLELLMEINMKSLEFNATLAGYLGPKTNHFVHELINFARSPYDDLISYECNVQYSARPLDGSEGLGVLPIMLNFVDFSMCVDEDECVSFTADLDVEDEDPDEIDELADLTDLNAPLLLELRRLLAERNNSSAATTLAPQPQRPTSQAQSQSSSEMSVQASGSSSSSSATTAAAAATTSNLMSNGVLAQDIGLEVAIERSMLDRLGSDYFMPQRSQQMVSSASARYARNLATVGNRSTDAGNASAATAAAAAVANATRVAQNTGVNPGLRAALRSAPRPRSSSVAPKRRRTTNRDLER